MVRDAGGEAVGALDVRMWWEGQLEIQLVL